MLSCEFLFQNEKYLLATHKRGNFLKKPLTVYLDSSDFLVLSDKSKLSDQKILEIRFFAI
jgi:hypothetical protein